MDDRSGSQGETLDLGTFIQIPEYGIRSRVPNEPSAFAVVVDVDVRHLPSGVIVNVGSSPFSGSNPLNMLTE